MVAVFGIAFVGVLMLAIFPDYLVAVASLFIIEMGMVMLQVVINPLLRVSGGEEHFAFNSVPVQLFFRRHFAHHGGGVRDQQNPEHYPEGRRASGRPHVRP